MDRRDALVILENKFKQALPKASNKKIKELAIRALDAAEFDIGMDPPEVVVNKSTYWTEWESRWTDGEGSGKTRTA